jgi:hypothetical protein
MIYNILSFVYLAVLMLPFLIFGYSFLKKSRNELDKDREDLSLVQHEFAKIRNYSESPSSDDYESLIISKWLKYCNNQVKAGRSASAEVMENIMYDISGRRDSIIRFAMTSLILLGLLGTFVGMTIAVFSASGIIAGIQSEETKPKSNLLDFGRLTSKPSIRPIVPQATGGQVIVNNQTKPIRTTEEKFGKLMGKLEPILGGMNTAFITSIFGLISSMFLGIVFTRYTHSRDDFRIKAIEFANDTLVPIFTPETEMSIGHVIEKYSKNMEEALGRIEKASETTFNHVRAELDKSSQNNIKLVEELTNKVREENKVLLGDIAKSMERLIKENLTGFQQESVNLANKLDQVVNSQKSVADQFILNSESIENLIEKIGEGSDRIMESSFEFSTNISNMGNIIDPITQLSDRISLLSSLINRMNPQDPLNFNVFIQMQSVLVDISNNIIDLKDNGSGLKNEDINGESVKEPNQMISIDSGTDITKIASDINETLKRLTEKNNFSEQSSSQISNTDMLNHIKQINAGIREIANFYRNQKSKGILKKLGLVK